MTPIEFTLWLNGAVGILGDQPPTREQWAAIQEKLGEAIGTVVASRLLETADEIHRTKERNRIEYAERARLMQEMLSQKQPGPSVFTSPRMLGGVVNTCYPPDEIRIRALDMLAGGVATKNRG